MPHISHYEKYPIYEPAGGGYYYEGRRLVDSIRVPHGTAHERLRRLARQLEREYDRGTTIRLSDDCTQLDVHVHDRLPSLRSAAGIHGFCRREGSDRHQSRVLCD